MDDNQVSSNETQESAESPPPPAVSLSPRAGLGASVYTTTGSAASDLRLVRRAIRERWPIPEEVRPRAVQALIAVIDHPSSLPSDRIRAVQALVTMDRDNVKAQGEGNSLGTAARVADTVLQLARLAVAGRAGGEPAALPITPNS